MLERTLRTSGTAPNLRNGTNPTQQTKHVHANSLFKQHASGNHHGTNGESTQSAVDVLLIANQIAKHKKSPNRIQQESSLIDEGARIEREGQCAGKSAEQSP